MIERIVIVGGGTAGWMSAAYLRRVLANARRPIAITVVEATDVPALGVGEATIPTIRQTLQTIGIPEWRFLAEADATFKNAIKFTGWGSPPGAAAPDSFYHPFDAPLVHDGFNVMLHWLALRDAGAPVGPFDQSVSILAALSDAGRSPKLFESLPYDAPAPYAYHLDAVKFGRLLRDVAMGNGVEHVVGRIVEASRDDDGDLFSVTLADGREVEGDFFIDCSGFAGLLIGKVLEEPFLDRGDLLLCDRAVVAQKPLADGASPRPYTTATAQSAGWTWDIDLNERSGCGYVYSSRFIDDDAARAEFLRHVGRDDLDTRVIPMRVGRRENVWVRNCLAIGLSAGFIEPLESTGIHFIELALGLFVDHLTEGEGLPALRQRYNMIFAGLYDDVANFVLLHYALNRRIGQPFWDHYRQGVPLPPALVEQLRIWAYKVPGRSDLANRVPVFDGYSYMAIMAGLGALPPYGGNLSPFLDLDKSTAALAVVAETRQRAVRMSPPHEAVLRKIRSTAF